MAATTPVVLTEHDGHRWHVEIEDAPVTDAVKQILAAVPVR